MKGAYHRVAPEGMLSMKKYPYIRLETVCPEKDCLNSWYYWAGDSVSSGFRKNDVDKLRGMVMVNVFSSAGVSIVKDMPREERSAT